MTCNCTPCQCPTPASYCGPGTLWDDTLKQCVPVAPKPKPKPHKCPKGQHWDKSSQQCVQNSSGVYTVWCRVSDQTTYLTSPGEPPEEPDDYVLTEYSSLADVPPKDDWPACEPEPEPPEVTGPAILPSGSIWCGLNLSGFQNYWVNAPPTQFGFLGPMVAAVLNPQTDVDIGQLYPEDGFFERAIKQTLTFIGMGMFEIAGSEISAAGVANNCGGPGWLFSMAQSLLIGFVDKWISTDFSELDIANRYYRHAVCPQLTLSADQATAAFLADTIPEDTFYTLVAANNQCPTPWKAYVQSQRSRPNPEQLATLRLRGWIDEGDYDKAMRGLGYTDQSDVDNLYSLTTQIPFVSDILRMMVRDVADPLIVQQFGLDDQFPQKWQGQLKEWGNQQGIEDVYAQYAWRAHWSIPSPTALYEMLRRLRNTPPPPGFADWETAVKTALIQQDILPFWIEPLLQLSYKPLTATDLVRSYTIGAINAQGVTDGYKQLGYSDTDAQGLTDYRQLERVDSARTLPLVRLYEQDGISRSVLQAWLTQRNFSAGDSGSVLAAADQRKYAKTQTTCVASLKKRFLKGELDSGQLQTQLQGVGLEAPEASNLVTRYQCEFASRDPHVALKYLNTLYLKAIIDVQEYLRRTGNLGILPDLAGRIIQQLDADLGNIAAAKQARALRNAQKLALQQSRAAARVQKAAAAAAAKAARQVAAANKAAAAARDSLDSAIKKAVKAGATLADADTTLTAAVQDLESVYGASATEAVAIVTTAVELTSPWSDAGFEDNLHAVTAQHLAGASGTTP